MKRTTIAAQSAMAALFSIACCAQDNSWMTAEIELNAAQAMLTRMTQVGLTDSVGGEEQLADAVGTVRAMSGRIERWGLENIVRQAPQPAGISAPTLANPTVQAIAHYGACGVTLYPELARNSVERHFTVAGEFAVFLISGYLRHYYLNEGGSDEQLAAQLTSAEMSKYSRQLQSSQDQLDRTLEACTPFFIKVIGEPAAAG